MKAYAMIACPKRPGKRLIVLAVGLISGYLLYGQSGMSTADTLKPGTQGQQEEVKEIGSATGTGNQFQGARGQSSGNVKKIKSGRPDMSKARGARPPSVIRPAGPSIPKGVGRPGGVGRKGGR
jgi:hypothetical protein